MQFDLIYNVGHVFAIVIFQIKRHKIVIRKPDSVHSIELYIVQCDVYRTM